MTGQDNAADDHVAAAAGDSGAVPAGDHTAGVNADTALGDADTVSHPSESTGSDAEPVSFADLGVAAPICAALAGAGIHTTFPIQTLTLPIALGGHDIIGQARTGTGKTLAFGVPMLQRLAERTTPHHRDDPFRGPSSLVVVPTRELAIQVADDVQLAGRQVDARVIALYGGRAYEPQIAGLRAGVDVVVGTPGRLLDMANQRHLNLSRVRILVLDEADKMLDMGFLPDVERILRLTPSQRQTMLFSATMPGDVVTLARRHLQRPTHVRAESADESAAVPTTRHHVFRAHHLNKVEVLARVLQAEGRGLTMVFCHTKRTADQVASDLADRHFAAAAVHGDLGQAQRERALRAFRAGKVDVLVATDVAARGLDVDNVTHVVNYECPDDENDYLHRIGRTGRAGRTGVAVTFVDWRHTARWKLIDQSLGLGAPEPVETYSTSPHLYLELGIPTEAIGTLPRAMRHRAGLDAEMVEDFDETGTVRSPRGPRRALHGGGSGTPRNGASGARHARRAPANADEPTDGHGRRGDDRPAGGADRATTATEAAGRRRSARPRRRTRRGVALPRQDGGDTSGSVG